MKKLQVLIEKLRKDYYSLKDDPSQLEIDMLKENLRGIYELVGKIGEEREERTDTSHQPPTTNHQPPTTDNSTTLADKYLAGDDRTVAARIQKKMVKDLKTAIGLNDKFVFIKELFNNNVLEYNDAVENLNIAGSKEQANDYLMELSKQYDWDEEVEPYQRFAGYIDKKFA